MLFNSLIFIFIFLPISLIVFYGVGRFSQNGAKLALVASSLVFYTWWHPPDLPLLLGSILFNFLVGGAIGRCQQAARLKRANAWLVIGILGDVILLGCFKYANFTVDNINLAFGSQIYLARVALPLAISFFTLQKIAYLIDTSRGETKPINLLDFSLFAAFYPQLIAGPIVHYGEVVPQLQSRRFGRLNWRNILVGLVIFAFGLFKKSVVADSLSIYANPLFAKAAQGGHFDLLTGWLAAVTFTLQLYFDFSGYSDMAIGLGRMLGVKLPLNFHSPLRAASIIDYWRRWHMTLQRFIVAYIFLPISVPLSRAAARWGLSRWPALALSVALPTLITFAAIGFWHGAGWTYLFFGITHGFYMSVNEVWREMGKLRRRALKRAGRPAPEPGPMTVLIFHLLTLAAVAFANVMFRAQTVSGALSIWGGMIGLQGLATLQAWPGPDFWVLLSLSVLVVFLAPNTQQIMSRFDPAFNWAEWSDKAPAPIGWTWKPNTLGLIFAGLVLFFGVMFIQRGQAVFIYFKF